MLSKETHETVIRFAPPLTITRPLIDRAVAVFRQVVLDKRAELGPAGPAWLPQRRRKPSPSQPPDAGPLDKRGKWTAGGMGCRRP